MQVLKQFSIPLKGLKIGHHDIAYQVDNEFFSAHESTLISDADIGVNVSLEKKSDHLHFDISFKGIMKTECDRCSDPIDFPISGEYEMVVKFDMDEREEEEVVYIHPDSPDFNCSKLIYDAIILSLPMHKTCDDVNGKECDPDVLDRFTGQIEEKQEGNAFTEALKNLKL